MLMNNLQTLKCCGYTITKDNNESVMKYPNKNDPIIMNNENSNKKTQRLKIYFQWNDDENNNMSNSDDVRYQKNNILFKFNTTLAFTQYVAK